MRVLASVFVALCLTHASARAQNEQAPTETTSDDAVPDDAAPDDAAPDEAATDERATDEGAAAHEAADETASTSEDVETLREAERFSQQGAAHAEREEFARSAEAFQRSLRLLPASSTAYNLALVLRRAGRTIESLALADSLLAGSYGEVSAEGRVAVESLIRAARNERVTLSVLVLDNEAAEGVQSVAIESNGARQGDTVPGRPLTVYIDAGAHLIEGLVPGRTARVRITVAPGETKSLALRLPPVLEVGSPRRRRRIGIGVTVAVVVASSIAVGLLLGLRSTESRATDPVLGEVVLTGSTP